MSQTALQAAPPWTMAARRAVPTFVQQVKAVRQRADDLSRYGLADEPGVPWDARQQVAALALDVSILAASYSFEPCDGDRDTRQEWLDTAVQDMDRAVDARRPWREVREEVEEAERALAKFLRMVA